MNESGTILIHFCPGGWDRTSYPETRTQWNVENTLRRNFFYKTSETSYKIFMTHDDIICKQRTRKRLKDSLNCKLKRHFETYNGSEFLKRICTLWLHENTQKNARRAFWLVIIHIRSIMLTNLLWLQKLASVPVRGNVNCVFVVIVRESNLLKTRLLSP